MNRQDVEVKPGVKLVRYFDWFKNKPPVEVEVESLSKDKRSFWVTGDQKRSERRFICHQPYYTTKRDGSETWPTGTSFNQYGYADSYSRGDHLRMYDEGQTIETILADYNARRDAKQAERDERRAAIDARRQSMLDANLDRVAQREPLYAKRFDGVMQSTEMWMMTLVDERGRLSDVVYTIEDDPDYWAIGVGEEGGVEMEAWLDYPSSNCKTHERIGAKTEGAAFEELIRKIW